MAKQCRDKCHTQSIYTSTLLQHKYASTSYGYKNTQLFPQAALGYNIGALYINIIYIIYHICRLHTTLSQQFNLFKTSCLYGCCVQHDLESLESVWSTVLAQGLRSLLHTDLAMVCSLPRRVPNGILLDQSAYSGFFTLKPLDNLPD